nr:immunoglobulin light chain junction region [Macaca mulatta]MOX77451.1 immunoglobulin light chain junction region [Macaca mulatta]MOX77453.1 immunoglobulin light chain junction region [Macaca mulatta]MOX77476.1 immunoglobulin light chain junction region [Macaca mulatta]MOX77498.1 immunoglobulin light chain junction region [Macaca mulatta]
DYYCAIWHSSAYALF